MWQEVKHQVDGSGEENARFFTFWGQACRVIRQTSLSCCICFSAASIPKDAHNSATRASKSVSSQKMPQILLLQVYTGTSDSCSDFYFHLTKLEWVLFPWGSMMTTSRYITTLLCWHWKVTSTEHLLLPVIPLKSLQITQVAATSMKQTPSLPPYKPFRDEAEDSARERFPGTMSAPQSNYSPKRFPSWVAPEH